MKASFFGLCLLVLSVQGSYAQQQSGTPTARTPAEQEILTLSRDKWQWMADKDVDKLAALFTKDAAFVHMGGTWYTDRELDIIRSGGIHYKHAEVFEASARFYGSTAIVLNRIRLDAVVGGNEVSNPFMVTEVYVQEGGKWKLATLTFSRLAGQ